MVEITETAGLRDLERANRIVQQLRGDGQRVCLDDFGAGAAAFHYLRALTVDYVKLDGQYTRRLLTHDRDASILRTMAELCRKLGVSTVAEMVETEEEAAELARLGADHGQGWLFGRPLPSAFVTGPPRPAPPVRPAKRQGAREEWR
jgi:EAL domain-containing protein (putative c-di-GMP-specific phosphodiesterase class I)